MASIADVFFRALLEDKQLKVDAQKSGDEAGETLGTRMSKGISSAMRKGLGVIAGAAAVATKGMVELDDVTAQFTADTGASADEADRARTAINRMAGKNLQPMREIGGALGKVHTDLGLVGDQAEATTEDFLHFARVTKRDAGEEVAAFDDILDAYGETADKIPGIMDKLVVSHQKYGGAINEDEAALAAMAPQLKAFNLGIDDGIALLDLFKSSGLDAAAVPKALNSAIQKLDGRPLKDFLTELAGIEDPGKRAQRAIEIFGAKAGVQLANAIKPGVASLNAFKITTQEAEGATDRARDAIDSTWGNRIQLLIKGATSRLLEFGSAFGPVLTGAASLASLGGALGLDRFVVKFAAKMLEAGKKGGESLIDGIGTATGAAGTVIGNFFASRLENVLDPTRPTLVGRVVRRVAAATGFIWGVTFGAATKLAEVVTGVLVKLPGAGAVRAAVLSSALTLGTLQGTTMGKAAGLAFKGGFLLGLAAIAPELSKATSDLGKQIHDSLGLPSLGDFNPKNWDWPLGSKNAPDWAKLRNDTETGAQGVADAAQTVFSQAEIDAALAAQRAGERTSGSVEGARKDAVAALTALGLSVADAESMVADGTDDMADDFGHIGKAAAKQPPRVALSMSEIAQAIQSGRAAIVSAMQNVINGTYDPLIARQQLAIVETELNSEELRKALKSKDPEIVADAQLRRLNLMKEQATLKAELTQWGDATARMMLLKGQATSKNLVDGLNSNDPQLKAFSRDAASKIAADIITLMGRTHNYGFRTGNAYIDGLINSFTERLADARRAFNPYVNMMKASSPPGPESPLHKIDDWGGRTGDAYVERFAARLAAGARTIRDQLGTLGGVLSTPLAGAVTPDFGATGLARATSVANEHAAGGLARAAERSGGDTYQTTLVMPAPPTRDPLEAIERAGFYQRTGVLNPRLRPAGA